MRKKRCMKTLGRGWKRQKEKKRRSIGRKGGEEGKEKEKKDKMKRKRKVGESREG